MSQESELAKVPAWVYASGGLLFTIFGAIFWTGQQFGDLRRQIDTLDSAITYVDAEQSKRDGRQDERIVALRDLIIEMWRTQYPVPPNTTPR